MRKIYLLVFCFFVTCLQGVTQNQLKTLYSSLEPKSIAQHLALYQLYPQSVEGREALRHAWSLLEGRNQGSSLPINHLPIIQSIIQLVNKQNESSLPCLKEQDLNIISQLANNLNNRKLRGFYVEHENQIQLLPPSEIDLARALFLTQFGSDRLKIRTYEASLDLMALQIKARLNPHASPRDKIEAINDFIFNEMGFRFPPQSIYSKDIDSYTFLSSVMDSRRGVCLGVSILYLCLAQRLDLDLQMITPPGHIFLRYKEGESDLNIETTARGIHLETEEYLNLETDKLKERTMKEVIGLAYMNQGAVYLGKQEYVKAVQAYERAQPYLINDKLLQELLGFSYMLANKEEKGLPLLKNVLQDTSDYSYQRDSLVEDFLENKVDIQGVKLLLSDYEDNRSAILSKKTELEEILKKFPQFRGGIFSLAGTWLDLHRQGEALDVLEHYQALVPKDPMALYYLTYLNVQRFDFTKAWEAFLKLENLMDGKQHSQKTLRKIRRALTLRCGIQS